MSSSARGDIQYPVSRFWACISALTAVLSIIIAVLILKEYKSIPIASISISPLLFYFVVTFVVALAFFALKIILFSRKSVEPMEPSLNRKGGSAEKTRMKWNLVILLSLTVACFFLPAILASFLSPMSWFMSIGGFTSGVSIEEVVFYFYVTKRLWGE